MIERLKIHKTERNKIVCKYVVYDLKNNLDISQFAGQKGLSTEHYLVKMIDRILGYLDRNSTDESNAVLTTFLDFTPNCSLEKLWPV